MMSSFSGCFVVLAVALVSGVVADDAEQPVVEIQSGRLRGKIVRSEYYPGEVLTFIGIPYAHPPVGDLRLALPQPVTPWQGVRAATQYGAACPQNEDLLRMFVFPMPVRETAMSEDCLFLDIYTPDVNGKKDVLVDIHGGGFNLGKSSIMDGSAMVAHGDIVVVSINYRLGLLGFLQNYNGKWSANLGMRDQQFALKWVQDNIAAFGGDPERVTISGESAGSICVSMHVLSPSSRGLFHRAISQSGSTFSMSATSKLDVSGFAVQMLGCGNLDGDATLACLRSKTVEEILATNLPGLWTPDDDTFSKDAAEAYSKGDFPDVDLLTGVVENEGFMIVQHIIPAISAPEIDVAQYQQQLRNFLHGQFGNNVDKIQSEIMEYYFGGDLAGQDPDFVRQQTTDIIGSLVLAAPTHLAAQHHSDSGAQTFFYRVQHQPSALNGLRPAWHTGGCDHGFEMIYTFGLPFMLDHFDTLTVDETDIQMAKIAMQYWINFIKTGNPNGEGLVEWKPFTRDEGEYLVLKPECEPASNYKPEDMSFWNDKLRGLDKQSGSRDEL